MRKLLMRILDALIDGIGHFARETESIGLEIGVMLHSVTWWAVITLPVSTILQQSLAAAAPEWVWGAALGFVAIGHLMLIVMRQYGQQLRANLIARDVVCLMDVGLWTYIFIVALAANVPFAMATSAAQVLGALLAGVSIALKLGHTVQQRPRG